MTAEHDVFLSHSSVDKPWVIKLKNDLLRYGVSVWLDKDEIRPGESNRCFLFAILILLKELLQRGTSGRYPIGAGRVAFGGSSFSQG